MYQLISSKAHALRKAADLEITPPKVEITSAELETKAAEAKAAETKAAEAKAAEIKLGGGTIDNNSMYNLTVFGPMLCLDLMLMTTRRSVSLHNFLHWRQLDWMQLLMKFTVWWERRA